MESEERTLQAETEGQLQVGIFLEFRQDVEAIALVFLKAFQMASW